VKPPDKFKPFAEFQFAHEDEPCQALWAVSALYKLGDKHTRLDDEEVRVYEKKFRGRPVGRVRKFLEWLPSQRREEWNDHFRDFAKKVKPVEDK
jgi:hypothetical protein